MKEVCHQCKWSKHKNDDYCYCVKYGCPIRYGRLYCVSFDRRENDEEVSRRVVYISRSNK